MQVENLREELKATQKAYQDKMDLAKVKMDAEWENKLATQQREGSALAAAALAAAEAAARDQLAALRRAHEEEVARLQAAVAELTAAAAAGSAEADAVAAHLRADLAAARATHAADVDSLQVRSRACAWGRGGVPVTTGLSTLTLTPLPLRPFPRIHTQTRTHPHTNPPRHGQAQLAAERARLEAAARAEVEATRAALQHEADERVAALQRAHGADLDGVRQVREPLPQAQLEPEPHFGSPLYGDESPPVPPPLLPQQHPTTTHARGQAVVEAQAAHATALAAAVEDAAARLAAAVQAERERVEALGAAALQEQAAKHAAATADEKRRHEEAASALTDTIASMKDNIEALSDAVRSPPPMYPSPPFVEKLSDDSSFPTARTPRCCDAGTRRRAHAAGRKVGPQVARGTRGSHPPTRARRARGGVGFGAGAGRAAAQPGAQPRGGRDGRIAAGIPRRRGPLRPGKSGSLLGRVVTAPVSCG